MTERNVAAAGGAVFLLGLGEELWKKFLPKYLEVLGAGPAAVGFFGTARDFFDAVYQYPGGWLADRFGRRTAFLAFIFAATLGYVAYLFSPSWQYAFLGLALAMAWQSMASPAIFAVIGDTLPKERRAVGFSVQAILKRIPMIVSPLAGGALIAAYGTRAGVQAGLAATIALSGLTVLLVRRIDLPLIESAATNIAGVWRSFHRVLKRLLISDVVVRVAEGLTDVFTVLYVTNVTGVTAIEYGLLVAVQVSTSIVVYFPAAFLADRYGRKPFVALTFVCFGAFPAAVVWAGSFPALIAAFVIGGIREIGEPSRKAMIVDLAEPGLRARTVGLYYLIRGLSIAPASLIGGLLWQTAPEIPFYAAGVMGLAGAVVFVATVEERYAG